MARPATGPGKGLQKSRYRLSATSPRDLNVGQSTNKQQTINNQRIAAFRSVNRARIWHSIQQTNTCHAILDDQKTSFAATKPPRLTNQRSAFVC
jgi:hypothetical protein